MRNFTPALQKITCLLLLFFIVKTGYSQTTTLKIKDFAIWGGSASANSYNSSQGVFIKEKATIQGNIGTNHVIDIKENLSDKQGENIFLYLEGLILLQESFRMWARSVEIYFSNLIQ